MNWSYTGALLILVGTVFVVSNKWAEHCLSGWEAIGIVLAMIIYGFAISES